MLAILIVAGIIAAIFAVPSPEKPKTEVKPAAIPQVVVIHHRPIYVQAQVYLIRAEIRLAEAKKEIGPVRMPEARLLNPSTAIERYRSHERKPS